MRMQLGPSINQIVIGDVGSGKTIVAFSVALAYLHGLESGQVVMLAPTEVLAFQHYQKLIELTSSQQIDWVDVVFLSNKLIYHNQEKVTKKKLSEIVAARPDAKVFWIGTHALLFNENVSPDLVLVDEQHRFGVRQRQFLTQKGWLSKKENESDQKAAHFLSFTATPIPRTLALTVYRSLKPHFLKSLQSRHPIRTQINVFDDLETKIVPIIQNELQKGRKIYVVCPKIESKEEDDQFWSVKQAEEFFKKFFADQILVVHGKEKQKKELLDEFKTSQEKRILIATTVIEVGVDVPEASLMVILNAERFGLAALHQIRGRVGRNSWDDNRCILVTLPGRQFAKRLQYLTHFQDGFSLAEKDLELRGSGDLFGQVQSGFDAEIEGLLGLGAEEYENIYKIVGKIDFANLQNQLPRLHAYLEKEAKRVWEE